MSKKVLNCFFNKDFLVLPFCGFPQGLLFYHVSCKTICKYNLFVRIFAKIHTTGKGSGGSNLTISNNLQNYTRKRGRGGRGVKG